MNFFDDGICVGLL